MGANIKPFEPSDIGKLPKPDMADRIPSLRAVPEKPTQDMLTAGSAAGHVPVETVWNIWRAMLKAAP